MVLHHESVPIGHLSTEELIDFINAFPALLWRIDLVKNKIEYLNAYRIEGLGANSGLLLQNSELRREVVVEEDIYLIEEFMQSVRKAETAATLFRLKSDGGPARWIKLTGVSNPRTPRYYIGYMLEATQTAHIVQAISESDAELEAMIELTETPALLIDPLEKTITAHNAAARDTFQYKPVEFNGLGFSEIYDPDSDRLVQRIYEELTFTRKWEGRLVFRRKNRSVFSGDVTMRRLFLKGRRLYRVSIHGIHVNEQGVNGSSNLSQEATPAQEALRLQSQRLIKKISPVKNITHALQIMLDDQWGENRFDAIIFSDIYAKKNRVVVYTAGGPFKSLPQGDTYAYEGTIAENIDRFKLDYLIVENTFASIKAIDWALFIPHGIRSYFAKPFYERRVIRSVLILCSEHNNYFSAAHLDTYALYDAPFLKALKNWRAAQKKRSAY